MKTFWTKYKTPILLIIGVILIALLLSGGRYGYSLHTQAKELEEKKEILQKQKDSLNLLLEESQNKIPEIRETQKSYYNEYKKAQQRAIRAETKLKDIIYRQYSIPYLDSLAKHIEYRDNL